MRLPRRTTDQQETLEAAARRLMAKIAATPNRGFDTARDRAAMIRDLDAILDQFNGHPAPPEPEHVTPEPDPALTAYLGSAITGNPHTSTCGVCGRSRYVNTTGNRVCIACDGIVTGTWSTCDDETAP